MTTAQKFAVIVAKYNGFSTDRLREGAVAAFSNAGIPADRISVLEVPGAFELPFAARMAAESGAFSAIVCLGCLIRGATPHFEFIASAVAHGLTTASGDTAVPMTFGVLTTNSVEEAIERSGEGPSNKGWEAAAAAIEMAKLVAAFGE